MKTRLGVILVFTLCAAAAVTHAAPPPFVAGTVVDETGRPVAGALVTLGTPRLNFVPGKETARAWTSAAGSFRIAGSCGQAACRMEVSHSDFASLAGTLDGLPREVNDLRLVLRRGATVTGRLIDEHGKPPAGSLEVDLVRAAPDDGDVFRHARVRPDGSFVLPHLPAGHAALHIRRAGAAQLSRSGILVPETGTADLGRILVPTGATLTVRVNDSAGRPASGARVSIQIADADFYSKGHTDPGFGRSILTTGADGAVVLHGLPPPGRKLAVTVCRAGSMPGLWRDDTVPRQPVQITLSPAVSLTGTVVDPRGAPVAGATVTVERNGAPPRLDPLDPPAEGPCPHGEDLATDADGRFTQSPLEPGWYRITARRDGFGEGTLLAVQVPPEGLSGLSIPLTPQEPPREPAADPAVTAGRDWVEDPVLSAGSTVAGKIRGLKPAELAWTEVVAIERWTPGPGIQGTVATDGSFRVGPLSPGKWGLNIWACGRQDLREIEVPPGGRELAVDVEFGPLSTVSGRMTEADGTPRPHADVYFYIGPAGFKTTTRSDGTFEARMDAGPDLDIRIAYSVWLLSRIRGLQPGEVPWLNVDGVALTHRIETGPDGTFARTDVDPVTWTVSVHVIRRSGSQQTVTREVTVLPGDKDVVLDVTFPPEGKQP